MTRSRKPSNRLRRTVPTGKGDRDKRSRGHPAPAAARQARHRVPVELRRFPEEELVRTIRASPMKALLVAIGMGLTLGLFWRK
jgi:hypothetical protein